MGLRWSWPVLLCAAALAACSGDPADTTTSAATAGSAGSAGDGAGGTGAGGASTGGESAGGGGAGGAPGAERMYGVTVDDVSDLPAIQLSLSSLTHKPTTRVVFDETVPASEYADAVAGIHEVSFVMGEILDSFYVATVTTAEYEARTQEYLDTLGTNVDIWEIGNEINGEWLCADGAESCTAAETAEVVAKMTSAFQIVKAAGRPAALTLYYNEDCWSAAENEVFAWAEANVPAEIKQGVDYVFFSYYEDDCNGLQPDWPAAFSKLAAMFPAAKLGFGECGTVNPASKAEYIDRYYRR
jgi:hypothetical protein